MAKWRHRGCESAMPPQGVLLWQNGGSPPLRPGSRIDLHKCLPAHKWHSGSGQSQSSLGPCCCELRPSHRSEKKTSVLWRVSSHKAGDQAPWYDLSHGHRPSVHWSLREAGECLEHGQCVTCWALGVAAAAGQRVHLPQAPQALAETGRGFKEHLQRTCRQSCEHGCRPRVQLRFSCQPRKLAAKTKRVMLAVIETAVATAGAISAGNEALTKESLKTLRPTGRPPKV